MTSVGSESSRMTSIDGSPSFEKNGRTPQLTDEPPKPEKVTEKDIIRHLLRSECHFGRKGTAMPHYTPKGWWECDLAYFTPAGYLTEFEIKVSKADFRADARKSAERGWRRKGQAKGVTKHAVAEAGNGPKKFWFCAPAGVIPHDELPEWAGLKEFKWAEDLDWRKERRVGWLLSCRTIVHAPSLKGRKFSQQVINHCRGVAYYRLINQLIG